ncbi:glycosyltransferase family 4 protein [Brevibacillus sp. H7]|uniref:glycosyltransferase family 4 protein n=1 Tax=Brevibacillus sp. H7 TaxID=3349138 RepID=UPI00380A887E
MKMAQGFKNIGCKVVVITAENSNTQKLKKKIHDVYSHYGVDRSIRIKYLSPSKEAFKSGRTIHDLTFCKKALQYAKDMRFDFVYCRSNLVIPRLTANEGIPTFVETHSAQPASPKWKDIYKLAHLGSFRGLITIHEKIKQAHAKRGFPKHKVLVLEDSVDLMRFDIPDDKWIWRQLLGLDKDKFYAVYCGHLYPEKGIEVILHAAKKLEHMKDVVFLFVGGLEKDKQLWEEYSIKNRVKNVKFIGFVPNTFVPKYLKAADCLLLAYKVKNMDYKIIDIHTTSPLKLFEYMASKRPIVATDLPTISKVLKHESNSLLVRPDDIADFCNGIKRLLSDRDLSVRLADRAYQDVQQYSWEDRCKRIVEVFDKN